MSDKVYVRYCVAGEISWLDGGEPTTVHVTVSAKHGEHARQEAVLGIHALSGEKIGEVRGLKIHAVSVLDAGGNIVEPEVREIFPDYLIDLPDPETPGETEVAEMKGRKEKSKSLVPSTWEESNKKKKEKNKKKATKPASRPSGRDVDNPFDSDDFDDLLSLVADYNGVDEYDVDNYRKAKEVKQ